MRRRRIAKLRSENPNLSGADIARVVGVCRERVSYVLMVEGLATKVPPAPRPHRYCLNCGKELIKNTYFCNRDCRSAASRMTLVCDVCGSHFERTRGEIRKSRNIHSSHTFCSKRCQGRWLGKTYGGRRNVPRPRESNREVALGSEAKGGKGGSGILKHLTPVAST